MTRTATVLLCLAMLAAAAPMAQADKNAETAKLDKPAPGFTLADISGNKHSLSDYKGKYVVLEWINFDCPFVKKHYNSGNMQHLQKTYGKKGVVWLSICSSGPGKQGYFAPKEIEKQIKSHKGMQTAYLIDADGVVGKMYGAKTTPHMFIINPEGVLVYAGGIDDKRSTNVADVKGATNYVQATLDACMDGEAVKVKTAPPYGCSVKYKN